MRIETERAIARGVEAGGGVNFDRKEKRRKRVNWKSVAHREGGTIGAIFTAESPLQTNVQSYTLQTLSRSKCQINFII